MAQVATFASVRVEAADQDAWLDNAEFLLEVGMEDAGNPLQARLGDGIGNVAQGQVGSHQGNPQAAGGQHHHHLFGVRKVRQEFGMAGEGDPAFVDHALVYGGGDHSGEVPVQAALARTGQGFQDERSVGLVQLPGNHRRPQGGIPDVQAAGFGRRSREGIRGHRQQRDRHTQLRGPLGEQVTTGNGNQWMRLGLRGEQQAQVRTYAGRLARGQGETLELHWAAWSTPGSLIST
ncbi:hypothetical protein D3C80_981550 [compost metagenome]